MLSCACAHAQTGPAWAWSTGKITNNGSVTVRSANGSSTYNAVKNPIGAVAKTNQSAVTQPPTVIIQATSGSSGGYQQVMPLLAYDGSVMPAIPTCPSGYTSVFTATISRYGNVPTVFNVKGTRFSWGIFSGSGSASAGWMIDVMPMSLGGSAGGVGGLSMTYSYYNVAGNLCVQ